MPDLSPYQSAMLDMAGSAVALLAVLAVLLAMVAGALFVRGLW